MAPRRHGFQMIQRADGPPNISAAVPCDPLSCGPRQRDCPARRQRLEGAISARVCRSELWTDSQFANGWPPGTGKSHLLGAIEDAFRIHNPGAQVVTTTATALVHMLTEAIRADRVSDFKASCR
jgi:hypothetical protein